MDVARLPPTPPHHRYHWTLYRASVDTKQLEQPLWDVNGSSPPRPLLLLAPIESECNSWMDARRRTRENAQSGSVYAEQQVDPIDVEAAVPSLSDTYQASSQSPLPAVAPHERSWF